METNTQSRLRYIAIAVHHQPMRPIMLRSHLQTIAALQIQPQRQAEYSRVPLHLHSIAQDMYHNVMVEH